MSQRDADEEESRKEKSKRIDPQMKRLTQMEVKENYSIILNSSSFRIS
jgi:hypothetical protein